MTRSAYISKLRLQWHAERDKVSPDESWYDFFGRKSDPVPTLCEKCGWIGRYMDTKHDYIPSGEDGDCEAVNVCPLCGSENLSTDREKDLLKSLNDMKSTMKIYLDTEFIAGFKPVRILGLKLPSWLFKPVYTIQLISIGLIREDGLRYYGLCSEFCEADADGWVKKNVISKLPDRFKSVLVEDSLSFVDNEEYKPMKRLGQEIIRFCGGNYQFDPAGQCLKFPYDIQFYGYYSDYDWVVFCSLFGGVMDLPKGFPEYCLDLKQIMDEKAATLPGGMEQLKAHPHYPTQINEHNALDDAEWNLHLHNFLLTEV